MAEVPGALHHVPMPKRVSEVSEATCGCKCALEGEPGLDQEQRQGLGLQSVLSCSSIHVFFCLFPPF